MTARVGALVSGRGSNLEAILRTARDEGWDARFLVVSNRPDAPALTRAAGYGAETDVLDHRGFPDRAAFDAALARRCADCDWIVLAGFMRVLGPAFVAPFRGRILNIHPSLLPALPGLDTHARALAGGHRVHGCTVHLVDEGLDAGPILAQVEVPVLPDDDEATLAARVLAQEHLLYPAVLRAALDGSLTTRFPARPQSGGGR